MDKPIIVLEIPHQRDAFAWIAWNGESEILNHAHGMESDNHRYAVYTLVPNNEQSGEMIMLAPLQGGWDRDELPSEAWKIAEREGKVGQVDNEGFMPVDQMPDEFDWAVETLFHDLHGGDVFRSHEEVTIDLECRSGHQAIKAKIALESAAESVGSLWDDYEGEE